MRLNDINKELPFTLHYISHLRKSDGKKSHEEGGRVTLDDFAGGKANTQYANYVFAMERDQQNPSNKDLTVFRCLKARFNGNATGSTVTLVYDPQKGTKHTVETSYQNDFAVGQDF